MKEATNKITKLMERSVLPELVRKLKEQGQTVVFTNGCFDILHAGHVRYLTAARKLGDCLIVGLNSDTSVVRLKGPMRPINCEQDRAEVLAGLWAVDYLVIFADQTAVGLVAELQPDIYVKGGDYVLEELPEAAVAACYGGRTVLIPEVAGKSSSRIIAKISGHSGGLK